MSGKRRTFETVEQREALSDCGTGGNAQHLRFDRDRQQEPVRDKNPHRKYRCRKKGLYINQKNI